jgi:hypothetical protein
MEQCPCTDKIFIRTIFTQRNPQTGALFTPFNCSDSFESKLETHYINFHYNPANAVKINVLSSSTYDYINFAIECKNFTKHPMAAAGRVFQDFFSGSIASTMSLIVGS